MHPAVPLFMLPCLSRAACLDASQQTLRPLRARQDAQPHQSPQPAGPAPRKPGTVRLPPQTPSTFPISSTSVSTSSILPSVSRRARHPAASRLYCRQAASLLPSSFSTLRPLRLASCQDGLRRPPNHHGDQSVSPKHQKRTTLPSYSRMHVIFLLACLNVVLLRRKIYRGC